ncbi:glutaredoxin domain-containing protein [Streptomyces sp. H10-C2]|uniref:glutaredoxin domain-containing protein n=1 Tax=unclassified Streptomyces TaxID=2593676 RepID=UPI0024BBD6B0|nr:MULTISPECIES: glutaredoxin domain-containing protein [unclassified Streptomyces]MDJ0346595.1 glutaredoxin domain-containing protein [Streptomyces sp. PH10-H1]MDJ0375032.1 glutaredoxin domain-containing protein [Streptomyces sp. H10-C2]
MTANRDEVVVYWRAGCGYCALLQLGLRRARLPFRLVDIWKDQQAAAFVRSVANGNETVPTVTVAGVAMVAPMPGQVLAAVAEHAPQLLPPERPAPWWRRLRPARDARARR